MTRLEKYKNWVVGHQCSEDEMKKIVENAQKSFESFTEEEKEALVQGVEFILDCSENPPLEDYEIYKMIIASRNQEGECSNGSI